MAERERGRFKEAAVGVVGGVAVIAATLYIVGILAV